nr:hypothetical protein [Tanacetum cinerariifolium]
MRYTIRGTNFIGADLIDPHMLSMRIGLFLREAWRIISSVRLLPCANLKHALVKDFFHVSFWQFSEAISKYSLKSYVYNLSYRFTDSFIDLMSDVTHAANSDLVMLCCYGGGGRVVVVVVAVAVKIGACVVDDAGLGCERSIIGTGVDSGGTEEEV